MRGQRVKLTAVTRPRGPRAVGCALLSKGGLMYVVAVLEQHHDQYWAAEDRHTGSASPRSAMWNSNGVYKYRDENLRRLGFKNFRAYRRGELWRSIQKRVLAE